MSSLVPLLGMTSLLEGLGLSGSILTAGSIVLTAWKGKHILDWLSKLGTWVRIGGAVMVLILVATSGIIPGVELSLDMATISGWAGDLWDAAVGVLPL